MSRMESVIGGHVTAPVLKLDQPISFWGGVDHLSGRIIDHAHPQKGECIASKALVVPMIRGSGGTPGTIASLMKFGYGPTALILGYPEINALTGVLVGERLFGTPCPIFLADAETIASLRSGRVIDISPDGAWTQRAVE